MGKKLKKRYLDGSVVEIDESVLFEMIDSSKAKSFVKYELMIADINVIYHEDEDTRATSDLASWRQYRRDLRNYVQAGAVATVKPTRPE